MRPEDKHCNLYRFSNHADEEMVPGIILGIDRASTHYLTACWGGILARVQFHVHVPPLSRRRVIRTGLVP